MARKRVRGRPVWTPQWEGVVYLTTCKFIAKNNWRCDHLHSREDLLQDAYLIFMKIRDMYPRVVEEKNFMALYRTALSNKMNDRALYVKRKREVHQDTS